MNALIINHEIQIEPLGTRVALHPFLAGMNHTQLDVAHRLCGGETFQDEARRFFAKASSRMDFI